MTSAPHETAVPAVTVDALLVGAVAPLPGARVPDATSGIAKTPVDRPLHLGPEGFEGDAQADRKHHGGPEKAVHHYARDHYPQWVTWWQETAPSGAVDAADGVGPGLFDAPGVFGENLTTTGLTEADVHIGDVYELGTAVVQVSQGRQPCWKLDARLGRRGTARHMQQLGRTGWYYRVLQPGMVTPGDELRLAERPEPDWPLARLIAAFFDRSTPPQVWAQAAAVPTLAQRWRDTLSERVERHAVEDWRRRLGE